MNEALENDAWVILSDDSDMQKWDHIRREITKETSDGFLANVWFVDDSRFQFKSRDEIIALVGDDYPVDFVFIVDAVTMSQQEAPLLVVEFIDDSISEFRAVPSAIQAIENNLSIANMDFDEFAEAVDADGVFRGF